MACDEGVVGLCVLGELVHGRRRLDVVRWRMACDEGVVGLCV